MYGTSQSAAGIANGSCLMMDPRQQAIGQLLAATANASNALGKRLASKTHTFVGSHAQRCLPAICEAARNADRRVKKTLMIKGAIALRTIHSVHAVKLEGHFWPIRMKNRDLPDCFPKKTKQIAEDGITSHDCPQTSPPDQRLDSRSTRTVLQTNRALGLGGERA